MHDAGQCLVCDDFRAGLIKRSAWEYYCGGRDADGDQ